MEQDRAPRYSARGTHRTVVRSNAAGQLRRRAQRQLPERGQSAARRVTLPAELCCQLRTVRRPTGDRRLRQDAARNRLYKAAGTDARLREIRTRYPDARDLPTLVVPDRALPVAFKGLEDQPESLSRSGFGDDLARQVKFREETVELKNTTLAAMLGAMALAAPAAADETPRYGGTLTYMIPADAPPSFDAHREATYATIHSAAPFYSTLIRINPYNPVSTTDFVCDLCTEMPQPIDDGKTYTFKIREGVKWHDASLL